MSRNIACLRMEAVVVLMPLRRSSVEISPVWLCRLLAGILIVGVAALRVVYLMGDCPLDLAPDEAHYWDWSRHLDWSYYSKGPLVAWLIRASCEVFGSLSLQISGTLMPAIRFPAVLSGALLLLSLYLLTVQAFGREGLALAVVAIASTVPVIAAGSALMTIDAPYTACWGWALVLTYQALFRGSAWAWPVAGLVIGIGILAKYTMVLFLPSVGLFLLFTPAYRRLLMRPGVWVMGVVAGLCCLPILIWNIQNDWVTFRHVHSLSGGASRKLSWMGPLIYVGGQAALLLGGWFICWVLAMIHYRPWRDEDSTHRYLWWLSAPMFLLFLAFSPRTEGGEINWPVTAYISGMVLMTAWIARQLESPRVWWRRWILASTIFLCVLGGMLTLFVHHTEKLYPVMVKLAGPVTEKQPCPLRRVDPTCRLRGWRTLGREVDAIRQRLSAQGIDPVLVCSSWSLPGEVGVYCQGQPPAYSIGLIVGDRHSQYDLWPSPVNNPEAFRGRTFIYLGALSPEIEAAFEGPIEPPQTIIHREQGHPLVVWQVMVCHGFKGFPHFKGRGY